MFELINLKNNTFYISMPTNVGVYKVNDEEVILIDTGIDEKSGKRILSFLEKENWKIKAIILTHAHTDHAGGCKYLTEETGCKAYATEAERIFVEQADLEPAVVYGAYPCKDFRVRFMNTTPCKVSPIEELELPDGMEIFPLPGHFAQMIGVKTPDDVYFVADSVIASETLEKTHISYIFDVESHFETLEKIKELQGKLCVPSHALPTENIAELAEVNIKNLNDISDLLLEILTTPKSLEDLVAEVSHMWDFPDTYPQFVMTISELRTHLTYLRHKGLVDYEFRDYRMLWKRA